MTKQEAENLDTQIPVDGWGNKEKWFLTVSVVVNWSWNTIGLLGIDKDTGNIGVHEGRVK